MNHRGMSAPERIFAFGLSPSGKSFWVKQSKDYASISGTSEVSPVHAAKIHRWWKNVLEEDAHGLAAQESGKAMQLGAAKLQKPVKLVV